NSSWPLKTRARQIPSAVCWWITRASSAPVAAHASGIVFAVGFWKRFLQTFEAVSMVWQLILFAVCVFFA
ncbi:MAG: hypothetical protein ABR578_10985, partial [Chromatocurvus sp.]